MIRAAILLLLFSVNISFADNPSCSGDVSHFEVPTGVYSPRDGVTYSLERFSARMVPKSDKHPDCLVKITEIERGKVRVSAQTLTVLLRKFRTKSLSDLRVEFTSIHVLLAGNMHKGIEVPFQIEGRVGASGEFLTLKADKVKAGSLPIKGLLEMFGQELDEVLGTKPGEGVIIKENTLYFRPEAFGNLRGYFRSAAVSSGELVVDFGQPPKRRASGESIPLKGKN